MGQLKTKEFWENALGRAIRTFAQTMLSCITVGNTITSFDWMTIMSLSATATVMSLLTSIILGLPEMEK